MAHRPRIRCFLFLCAAACPSPQPERSAQELVEVEPDFAGVVHYSMTCSATNFRSIKLHNIGRRTIDVQTVEIWTDRPHVVEVDRRVRPREVLEFKPGGTYLQLEGCRTKATAHEHRVLDASYVSSR